MEVPVHTKKLVSHKDNRIAHCRDCERDRDPGQMILAVLNIRSSGSLQTAHNLATSFGTFMIALRLDNAANLNRWTYLSGRSHAILRSMNGRLCEEICRTLDDVAKYRASNSHLHNMINSCSCPDIWTSAYGRTGKL